MKLLMPFKATEVPPAHTRSNFFKIAVGPELITSTPDPMENVKVNFTPFGKAKRKADSS
jgi:hypothetical protein